MQSRATLFSYLQLFPKLDCMTVFSASSFQQWRLLQVWNVNPYSRFVGVFHVQGSSWDRTKRYFSMHNHSPQPLHTKVCRLLSRIGDHACTRDIAYKSLFSSSMRLVALKAKHWQTNVRHLQVRPADVEFGSQQSSGLHHEWTAKGKQSTSWAAYNNKDDSLITLRADGNIPMQLRGATPLSLMTELGRLQSIACLACKV